MTPTYEKLWASLRARDFKEDDAMWNSGVLGIGSADRSLLDDALVLYDKLGAAGLRHFATEQLVEGVVLGRTGRVNAASRTTDFSSCSGGPRSI